MAKVKDKVMDWVNKNNLILLSPLTSSRCEVAFKITEGKYHGLMGVTNANFISYKSLAPTWRLLTKESKCEYICRVFDSEGFTVLAVPISLQTGDSNILAIRRVDNCLWRTRLTALEVGDRPPAGIRASYGESLIEVILSYNNIIHEREYSVNINGRLLRFDFFLPKHKLYIEYHGRQHFNPGGFMSESNFDERKVLDKSKQDYAENNGSYLMIPYTEDSISKVLNFMLTKLDVAKPTKKYINNYNNSNLTLHIRIAEYYLEHSVEETVEKFKVSKNKVFDCFKKVYKKDKHNYLRELNNVTDEVIITSSMEHGVTYTCKKFNICYESIDNIFKKNIGKTASEVLEPIRQSKRLKEKQKRKEHIKEVAEHAIDNLYKETAELYGYEISTVSNMFKEHFGIGKKEFLSLQNSRCSQ